MIGDFVINPKEEPLDELCEQFDKNCSSNLMVCNYLGKYYYNNEISKTFYCCLLNQIVPSNHKL